MANYHVATTVNPTNLQLTEVEVEILKACAYDLESNTEGYYIYSDGSAGFLRPEDCSEEVRAYLHDIFDQEELEDQDLDPQETLEAVLQKVSDRTRTPIQIQMAFTCSKMRPDGFGGAAIVILPEKDAEFLDTQAWAEKKIQDWKKAQPQTHI